MSDYIDLYLRAGNAGALASACPFLRGEDGEGNRYWIEGGQDFALSIIGALILEPGDYDEEGNEVSPPVIDDSFHANLRCTEEVAALVPETVRVSPSHPRRVWL